MTATKIQPGNDMHLTLLMAPHSLNFVTGADRAALLAYGRDVFAAARASQCLAQIEEPAQPVAEICSASHDDAQFGERDIKLLRDISGLEYGTRLYAGAAPAAVAPSITEPYTLAEIKAKIASHDYNAELLLQHAMLLLEPAAVAGPAREEIAVLRAEHGITSNGRGIKEFEQVDAFVRAVLQRWGAAPALEAPAAPTAPAPKFDLRTSAGGRGYVAWHFANVLKRHDFHNYIHNTLAADFACALARALETPEAQGATDDAIDAIVFRQTGFDGDGYQAMTADELRRIVRSALDELAAAPQAPAAPVAYLDLGAGGYMDLGTDLSEQQLGALPKGRHMLAIIGTHGIDGYAAAPAAPAVDAALPSWWPDFIKCVAELPDRNSPEDEPDAMIATAEELGACALAAQAKEGGA